MPGGDPEPAGPEMEMHNIRAATRPMVRADNFPQ